jgi:UDP-GlcNAc:undecaprenyl-phosphate/decaprenyl-phosphate GlcNAc-1-phosphate transferase
MLDPLSSVIGSITIFFEAIFAASILGIGLSLVSIKLAHRFMLVDQPLSAPHKRHLTPTPLAGGIALVITVVLTTLLFHLYDDPYVRATLLAAIPIFLFGLWDDIRGIPPILKLVGQLLAVTALIWMGVTIRVLESPEFFLGASGQINLYLDWALTILWVVGITNAFNFVDSMDGLAVGIAAVALAFFMLVTLASGQASLSYFSAILLGTCIGLYFLNSQPARMFLGDSGAQTLGFILAALAIAYRPQGANQSSSWVVPIMLLGVPIFDMTLVVISRLRQHKPVYKAGLDHTYHRLVAAGWSSTRAVLAMQMVALLLGCLGFIVLGQSPLQANVIFLMVILIGVVLLIVLDHPKRRTG